MGRLLREGERVAGEVRGRDGAEAGEGDGAAAGAGADRRRGAADARVRAVLQRRRERLARARLGDAEDVDLGDVARVRDVPGGGEGGRGAAADRNAAGGELSRADSEGRG